MRLSGKTHLIAAFAAVLAIAGASASTADAATQGGTADPLPTTVGGVNAISENGFGENANSYAWSEGWFKGKLYVGTGRNVECVENETTQFFVPLEQKYTTNPLLNVRCPPNPFELDLRAEIWQYTPATHKWLRVFQSPLEDNPSEPKLPVAKDIAFRGMVDYTDPEGKQAIYAAGVSADEYIPKNLVTHPPQIMRSYDGVHWEALNLPSVVVHYPLGNTRAMGFRSLIVWKHHLYVTATPDLTGNGALFEIAKPWSSHPRLIQVTPPNLDVFEVQTFDGNLYVGCGEESTGYSVWEASGEGRPWVPIVTGGAGRGPDITSVVSMHVYRNALYVGASGWYQNTLPQSEMIKIGPEGAWTLVVGDPRKLPSGQTAYPTSGLEDGFDSLFNAHFWRMEDFGGALYVGTNSWGNLVKGYKGKGWLGDLVADSAGFQLWATCDGEDFVPVTRDAFGVGEYNFGGRTLQASGNGRELFIGTANHAQGTFILDDKVSACSSLISDHEVAAPSAMIAQADTHASSKGSSGAGGTLLSWNPSRSAVRYRVLSASELSLTVYMEPQPTVPGGFPYEGAEPILTEPETPGAIPVTLTGPSEFETLATTTDPYFVAHQSGKRVYEVMAEGADGRSSGPSDIQIAPEPEPPATFASLQGVLSAPGAGFGTTAATAARVGAPTRLQRLLAAARSSWSHGRRGAALRDVHELNALSAAGSEVSAMATRLERSIRYASVAGEP